MTQMAQDMIERSSDDLVLRVLIICGRYETKVQIATIASKMSPRFILKL